MSEPIIDLKDVLDRVQDDKELLVELFDIYQEDFIIKRKDLEEGLKAKDVTKVREAAHSMKGASGNISAKSMHAMCMKIEHMARDGSVEGLDALLPTIDGYFEQIKVFAANYKKEQAG
jgi:HPt (histidine-containing phosphotransfer) domain-containing protein